MELMPHVQKVEVPPRNTYSTAINVEGCSTVEVEGRRLLVDVVQKAPSDELT